VPPLALPDLEHLPDAAALAAVPAVALFLRQFQSVRPDYRLAADEVALIAAICHRLDGLPLALELAAARGALFAPHELLRRLDDQLALLSDGARDLPVRQQTIRAAIGWSYDLLAPDEQRLLAHLSVFVGGFSLDAVGGVYGVAAERGLETLLQNSLVRRRGAPQAETRFELLELVRAFAHEQLVQSAELDAAQARHAAFFLDLVEQAAPGLFGAEQAAWLDRLAADYDNIRAALTWSLATAAPAAGKLPAPARIALRFVAGLWFFWALRSGYNEAQRWIDAALMQGRAERGQHQASGDTAQQQAVEHTLAPALTRAGKLAEFQGDNQRATRLLSEALALHEARGNAEDAAITSLYLGRVARNQGDYARAEQLEQHSLKTLRGLGSRQGVLWALFSLGDTALDQGDLAAAEACFGEALELCRADANSNGTATALMNLGRIAYARRDYPQAQYYYNAALAAEQQLGDLPCQAEVLLCLGRLAQTHGDLALAVERYRQSLRLHYQIGGYQFIAPCLEGLAGVATARSDGLLAARLFGAAAALRAAIGTPLRPIAHDDYQRDLLLARTLLGEERWQAAFAEGAALATEAAIKLATTDTHDAATARR
jgi:predicted ATPase